MRNYDYLYKCVILGSEGSGKKSLVLRYTDNIYTVAPIANLGCDFKIRTLECEEKRIKQQIWPISSRRRNRDVGINGAHYFLICWDLTDPNSCDQVAGYVDEIAHYASESAEAFIVGTKSDCLRAVGNSIEEIQSFAQQHGVVYLGDASARTGANVDAVFLTAAQAKLACEEGRRHKGNPTMVPELRVFLDCCANPITWKPKNDVMLRQMTVHCLGDAASQVQLYQHIRQLDHDSVQCLIQKKDSHTQKILENFALTYALGDSHMSEGNAAIILIDLTGPELVCLTSLLNNMRKLRPIKFNDHYNVIFLVSGNVDNHLNLPRYHAFRDRVCAVDITLDLECIANRLKQLLLTLRDSQCKFGMYTTKAAKSLWSRIIGPGVDKSAWRPAYALLPLSQVSYTAIVDELQARVDALEAEQREQQRLQQEQLEQRLHEQEAQGDLERVLGQHMQELPERIMPFEQEGVLTMRERCLRAAEQRLSGVVEGGVFAEKVVLPTEEEEAPEAYCCPIGLMLMEDPVIDVNGHTFERANIERWFREEHQISPITGALLSDKTLIPNYALRHAIEEWKAAHPQRRP